MQTAHERPKMSNVMGRITLYGMALYRVYTVWLGSNTKWLPSYPSRNCLRAIVMASTESPRVTNSQSDIGDPAFSLVQAETECLRIFVDLKSVGPLCR